jgi:hypothetical protein
VHAVVALPLIAAAYSATFGARTELRLREPGDVTASGEVVEQSLDSDNAGEARLLANFKAFELGLGYLPRLTFRNLADEPERDLLHGGELAATFRFRRLTLSLREVASYGERSFSPLVVTGAGAAPGAATPETSAVAPSQVALDGSVSYVSSDTTLSVAAVLTRRSTLSFSSSYFVGGGIDESDRALFPFTTGVRGTVAFERRATRIDTLVSSVDALAQRAEGPGTTVRTRTVAASEGWRRSWSRSTDTDVRAGAGLTSSSEAEENPTFFPSASAALIHRIVTGPRHGRLELTASASVDNVVDQLSGRADTRAQVAARALWTLEPLSFYAEGSRAESIGDSDAGLSLTSAAAGMRAQLSRHFATEFGLRLVDQDLGDQALAQDLAVTGFAWAIFAALEYRGDPIPLD